MAKQRGKSTKKLGDQRVGRLLRKLRERREWDRTETAERCGISRSYWVQLELATFPVTDAALVKIARGFGLQVESLEKELGISPAMARTA